MEYIHLRIATHENVLSACNAILPTYRTCEAPGVTMSELLDAVDEKPRMVVARKGERCPIERDRPGARRRPAGSGAGLPVQAAGGRVQFSTTTSGMSSKSFSLFVTRATPSAIAWAAIWRS